MTVTNVKSKAASYSKWIRKMGADRRLQATHISLFAGLFVCWQKHGLDSPFPVDRRTLMSYSRIASIATYHKCIRELYEYGYIRYQPSYDPNKGSLVWLPELLG